MLEIGINLQDRKPQQLCRKLVEKAAIVISMGCDVDKACLIGSIMTEDWDIKNPKGKPLYKIREIRDEIKCRVSKLLKSLNN
jgi:arsenate reductase